MNRKKRLYQGLAGLGLALVLLGVLFYGWRLHQRGVPGQPVPPGPTSGSPTPGLVANDQLPTGALLSQAAIEAASTLPPGGQRLGTRLMKWGTYIPEVGNQVTSYYVSPNRQVWVVKESRPSFEYRHGTMKDATVTLVYDAETGRLLHLQVKGRPDGSLGAP